MTLYHALREGPAMKFTLTYDGELRPDDKPVRKWEIRKKLHPQLEELWTIHPALKQVAARRYWPVGGAVNVTHHHTEATTPNHPSPPRAGTNPPPGVIDLCATIVKRDKHFLPLVRKSHLLSCALKILFLRKEPPGKLYQGGDLDNRLKTLFDALGVPPHDEHVIDDFDTPHPMYTVLEDDSLISKIEVETHQLLTRPGANTHEVRLVVEVDVRVAEAHAYNQAFLGD